MPWWVSVLYLLLLATLGLSQDQWSVLALQIQKQAIAMLHGLDRLEKLENKAAKKRVAWPAYTKLRLS